MPYLYRAAIQAHEKGTPMLRAMMLEFPHDPACDHLDLQYMLGDSLFVAPVFSHDGSVTYYVPGGKWTNFFTGEVIEGPCWIRQTYDFMNLPLLVRPNAVIPIGSHNERPDYDYSDDVTLQVYQLEEGQQLTVEIPSLDGKIETRFSVRREDDILTIQRQGAAKPWNALLVGIESVENAEIINGTAFLRVNDEVDSLALQIRDSNHR
jgi:alpha-D-xyloside xylohydrolase